MPYQKEFSSKVPITSEEASQLPYVVKVKREIRPNSEHEMLATDRSSHKFSWLCSCGLSRHENRNPSQKSRGVFELGQRSRQDFSKDRPSPICLRDRLQDRLMRMT